MFELVDIFKNDTRFILKIRRGGDNLEELTEYSEEYSNVFITGRYYNDERIQLIKDADILCYNYPCCFLNNNALANKYYDGLIFKRPLWGNLDAFSGKYIEENKVVISLKYDEQNILDKLYDYYMSFDADVFSQNCEEKLQELRKVINIK